MALETEYKHLEARPGSNYRQLFVKGRRIRAGILYRLTINVEQLTPEEVATGYNLPLAIVLEAIEYCKQHPEVLAADREMEDQTLRKYGLDQPPNLPRAPESAP